MRKVTFLDWILEYGNDDDDDVEERVIQTLKHISASLLSSSSAIARNSTPVFSRSVSRGFEVFFGRSVSHVYCTTQHRFERTKGVFEDSYV